MAGTSTSGVALEREPANTEELASLRHEVARLRQELDEHTRLNSRLSDAAEQFIGAVTHDVKNPLAAIKVNVQGLKRTLERGAAVDPEQWAERLGRIEHAVAQTLEHIAVARARASANAVLDRPLQRETTDLVALAREQVDRCREVAGPRRLRIESHGRVLVGEWDPTRLREAIHAVLDNALRFSPDARPVTVSVERDADAGQAVLRCRDSGIGIPEPDLAHVCERFYRGENVVGHYKGAGLGLFEAEGAITAHGGSLTIESQQGSGCMVTLRLPIR